VASATRGAVAARRRRRRLVCAVLLQCIPLLAASQCIGGAWGDDHPGFGPTPLVQVIICTGLVWGTGYLCLGRWVRFALVALAGGWLAVVLGFGVLVAGFTDTPADHKLPGVRANVKRAAVQAGAILAGAVVLVVTDTLILVLRTPPDIDNE
jgi:hypothetical protein